MSTTYIDKETIKLLAQMNLRGIPDPDLLAKLQEARDNIDILTIHPDCCMDIEPYIPKDFPDTREKYLGHEIYHYKCVEEAILKEFERRRNLNKQVSANQSFDKELVETIKERIPVADVLDWYTDVFIPKGSYRKNWKFRCTLHGQDNHPSGAIDQEKNRWSCWTCKRRGDVFDAVQEFEKVTFPEAVAKLARYIGLDTQPIFTKREVRGGVPV